MSHTPWKVVKWKRVRPDLYDVVDDAGVTIASHLTKEGASIIAAAPELLAMLKRLDEYIEEFDGICPVCDRTDGTRHEDYHADDCELAALIKKARGEC